MIEKPERVLWVDVARFAAILAVLVDHTNSRLFSNPRAVFFSYYSVSLFVILMGITSYWSCNRQKTNYLSIIKRNSCRIVRPYIIATLLYGLVLEGQFDCRSFISHLVHFDACGPFYYVLLYLQLLILTPLFYRLLNVTTNRLQSAIIEPFVMAVTIVISVWTTNHTDIMGIYGGGGRLFGGTYLVLLLIGMIIGKYCNNKEKVDNRLKYGMLLVSVILTIAWAGFISLDQFKLDSFFSLNDALNPPSVSLSVYALLLTCTFYLSDKIMTGKLITTLAFIGRHTMYIFLYHVFFIKLLDTYFSALYLSTWIKGLIYLFGIIAGSIIVEIILEKLHIIICKIYQ